jgi:hypothetical protein
VKRPARAPSRPRAARGDWTARDDLTGEARLTEKDIRANAPTIDNVRLWDRDPLLMTFGQLQEIRTYYDFVSVDDDRYWIDGKYRQVLLSPRELNVASLPTRTFINEHLTFTHGMGLTLGPVNQVTTRSAGAVHQGPAAGSERVAKVTRPQIYFGDRTRRQHEAASSITLRRRERLHVIRGQGACWSSRPRRLLFATYRSLKVLLERHHQRELGDVFRNIRARGQGRPFWPSTAIRTRDRHAGNLLDSRRLHSHDALSLRPAAS